MNLEKELSLMNHSFLDWQIAPRHFNRPAETIAVASKNVDSSGVISILHDLCGLPDAFQCLCFNCDGGDEQKRCNLQAGYDRHYSP
jgi:hypothetical protein